MKLIQYLFLLLLFHFPLICFSSNEKRNDVPEVHIAIIRLNYSNFYLKGYYEFTETFRKALPEDNYTQLHNIYYIEVPPADFGYTEIKSILTGKPLVYISTFWMGGGRYDYPSDSLFSSDYKTGFVSAEPDTLVKLFTADNNVDLADSAWIKIKYTDIVHRIASQDKYEAVVIYEYNTNEWLIILYTRPIAPIDMALIDNTWPKTLISRNIKTVPEIIVHNFSDTSLSVKAQLEVNKSGQLLYKSLRDVSELQSDSSVLVFFDSIFVSEAKPLLFNFKIMNSIGINWQDSYTYNDTISKIIQPTAQPVFRPVSSIKHPGNTPMKGVACDFDGDNYIDIIQYKPTVKFWKNVQGYYYDITNQSSFELNPDVRLAVVNDFNNDLNKDILLIFFGYNPILLSGDGSGIFTDITADAGLLNVISYFDVEAFDFDNDEDVDLIFQSYDQEVVLLNDGNGHFTDITSSSGISDIGQTHGITAGDLNNDGFKDIVLTNWGSRPKVFLNNTDGSFTFFDGPWDFDYGRMSLIFDYDNDGLDDILFARVLDNAKSLIFRNEGNLTFEKRLELPSSFHADAADINGDGMIDLILDHLHDFTFLINRNGKFIDYTHLLVDMEQEVLQGALGNSPRGQFIDLDNDADLDIYSKMVVFENQGFDSSITNIESPATTSMPILFELLQNYPNPFNSSTTIKYRITQKDYIKILVYDINGKFVRNLFEGLRLPGSYSIAWDGLNELHIPVSSGCYFYQLKATSSHYTKKMLLIR